MAALFRVLAFVAFAFQARGDNVFILSEQGDSCAAACGYLGRECVPSVPTNNSSEIFTQLGVNCTFDDQPWWAPDQPSYVSSPQDPNYGKCLGYVDVPESLICQGRYWSVRRVCQCGNDIQNAPFFGTVYSGGVLSLNETVFFSHQVEAGSTGVMTHFWTTAPPGVLNGAIFRYYVDGEEEASIAFTPGLAVGVGFNDTYAPWGTKWFGMEAGNNPNAGSAYFLNFQIPFGRSIKITAQHPSADVGGFYMIVRGAKDKPVVVGGYTLPQNARLHLQKVEGLYQPLDWVTVTDVPSGSGLHFMATLAVQSGNLNFLEGCYHAYTPYNQAFPGTLFSSGTEDYYDSGWYFDAGQFHSEVSGFTHLNQSSGITWSAYRFHDMDPIVFYNTGFRFVWRNGDMVDPHTGLKCFTESGGPIVGSPTQSYVYSYSWVYLW